MSVAQHSLRFQETTTEQVDYRIASTRAERAAAFRLVYESYLEAGLGEHNDYSMRVTPYHLLPTTETFLATRDGRAILTMSLIADGDLGLPMQSVYGDVVQRYRQQGSLCGEVSCLAERQDHLGEFFPIFFRSSRLLMQYARRRRLDALLVACHPRHARFYRRCLGFHQVGEERAYPSVRNHPAVALSLEFARVRRERPQLWDSYVKEPFPDEQLWPRPISPAQRAYFSTMVDPNLSLAPLNGHRRLQAFEPVACTF